jgi:cytochrome c oxidase assembly factor CtaG
MSSVSQAILSSWSFDPKIPLGLAAAFLLYFRGWLVLHRTVPERFPLWRLLGFASGLLALWVAIASPLDAFSGLLLSAHMVQHLLLMAVAPPLILLGAPFLPLLRGLPRTFARDGVGPFLTWHALRRAVNAVSRPSVCWFLMAVTLCGWHIPAAFDLALRFPGWHKVEHACFLGASLLFWWPVVRPFPSRPQAPLWSVPLYLFAADVLNTAISAVLTFSEHVLYPTYAAAPRLFGTTPLGDQSAAGVIMWVPGSLFFLIPAAVIAIQYLSASHRLVRPDARFAQRPVLGQILPDGSAYLKTGFCRALRRTLNRALRRSSRKFDEVSDEVRDKVFFGRFRRLFTISRVAVSPRPHFGGDLLAMPWIGRFLRAASTRHLMQGVLFVVALAVIADGLLGPQVSSANLAGVLPWTYWRAFVVIALLAAGNLFCMACPFSLFRELGRRLGLPQRSWPRVLRSKWFALGLLVVFFWAYEVFSLWDKPIWTAWLIINYFLIALVIDALFSGASFCKYVCPIGQFQFVASLVSPLEVMIRKPDVCASCKTHDCLRGNSQQRGCEMGLYLPRKSGNLDCTFCLDCVRACPHDNIGMMVVPPGLTLVRDPARTSVGRLSRRPDLAALSLVFVFAAFVNAALMVTPILHWRDQITARMHLTSNLPITSALFFLALVLAPITLVGGSALAGRTIAGIATPARQLICRFSFALIPLAASMWAAHFLFHFIVGWDSAWPILQRAFADLGLAVASQPAVSGFNLHLGMDHLRMLQTVLLDLGLLATLYLGWRVAREYAPKLRLAFRVVAPWSSVAVALYWFGVWTCLQPMQMRGLPSPMS